MNKNIHKSVRSALIYGPMYLGLISVVVLWLTTRWTRPTLLSVALLPIALSCFLFAFSSGNDDLTDRYDLALGQIGIYVDPRFSRIINFVFGIVVLGASYLCAQ